MKKTFRITLYFATFFVAFSVDAQSFFRPKERLDNLQDFDAQKYSWGFYLAANNMDYKIVLNPTYGMDASQNLVSSKPTFGFGAGLIGRVRLDNAFDIRIEPALQFTERQLTFTTAGAITDGNNVRSVKSTYLDIPLLLEYHGDRWYNSRPYLAAGFNYLVNLQSNSKSADDNLQGIFRTTTTNFAWSAEIGMQFYFSRFKLTPGIRGTFILNNELVADNPNTPPYWAGAISTMQTRAVMFVLKFE